MKYQRRNSLIQLFRQMYIMSNVRDSSYLGANTTRWREKVPPEYWEPSNHPQNSVDIADAVLGGHSPQFKVTVPGGGDDDLTSRAEKFLLGVLRTNSRRQGADLVKRFVHRTVLDGGAGMRITWDPNMPAPEVSTLEGSNGAEPRVVAKYPRRGLPINLEVVKLDKLYTDGMPCYGSPFRDLYHVEKRSADSVFHEWSRIEGADIEELVKMQPSERKLHIGEYIQYWGYGDDGEVLMSVSFDNIWIWRCQPIAYPRVPYVLSAFKEDDHEDPTLERLGFLFSIIWATEREEYMASRIYRIIDMLANLVPVQQGGDLPIQLEGTWGRIAHLRDPNQRITFPQWPGNPPDVWRLLEDIRRRLSQGTFSSAMYGDVSSRISGYGLAQLIGADTLRTDTPRTNLEMALSCVAEHVFDLLGAFSRGYHMVVTVKVKTTTLSAMLSGEETGYLEVDTVIKPKQTADEIRLATIGAQLASLPNPPLSMRTILEQYFGLAQPEDEIQARLSEDAMKDPMIRLLAMLEVLKEHGSPYAAIVEAQLQQLVEKTAGPVQGAAPPPQEAIPGMGLGLPQGAMGNPPNPLLEAQGADLGAETQQGSPTVGMFGGPTE